MSLKSLLTEAVVVDSMYDIESELMDIKETILEQMIIEGVDDPGILKCVFMAGGPGSGKSFTAMEIFGIDKRLKTSFSHTGLKTVNSDSMSYIESISTVSVSNDLILNFTPYFLLLYNE